MTLSHPVISAQIVRHVRDCLELAGVPSRSLLAQRGISAELLEDREASVDLGAYVRFFEAAAEASGNPHFGLHAARLMGAGGLGPLSFLFLSAPSLGQAFETFTEHLDAMQEATFNAFEIEGAQCHFTYAIRDPAIVPRRQDSEYSIGVMCNLVRQFLGHRTPPSEVHFEHERRGPLAGYEDYFGCPVFFEQDQNRLYLPSRFLGLGSSALSSELFPIIADHLRARLHSHHEPADTAGRVRDLLMASPGNALPGLEQTAERLGLSRATLLRRLAGEGVRFAELADERRMGLAQQLLAGSTRPVSDIALASGYSETASFTRAFQRRFGTTPTAWRKARREAG